MSHEWFETKSGAAFNLNRVVSWHINQEMAPDVDNPEGGFVATLHVQLYGDSSMALKITPAEAKALYKIFEEARQAS